MDNLDKVLRIADKNMLFFTMLEGALIKLECEIIKERHKYSSLSHDSMSSPIFQINIHEDVIIFFLGEIKYCINIKNIRRRLHLEKLYISIEDIEKALLDELEEVLAQYLL